MSTWSAGLVNISVNLSVVGRGSVPFWTKRGRICLTAVESFALNLVEKGQGFRVYDQQVQFQKRVGFST